MRTIEQTIYTFDELNDEAKERARAWFREDFDYFGFGEAMDSLKDFCSEFGVKVLDYSMGDTRNEYIKTDATNANFRGLKVKDFDREAMPTGVWFDNELRYTFADEFKRTGDALHAFQQALDQLLSAVRKDIEYQYSDECVDEIMILNEYEFTEEGKPV